NSREPSARDPSAIAGVPTSSLQPSELGREPSAREPSTLTGVSAPSIHPSELGREPSARDPSAIAGVPTSSLQPSELGREPSAREPSTLTGVSAPSIHPSQPSIRDSSEFLSPIENFSMIPDHKFDSLDRLSSQNLRSIQDREPTTQDFKEPTDVQSASFQPSELGREPSAREPSTLTGVSAPSIHPSELGREPSAPSIHPSQLDREFDPHSSSGELYSSMDTFQPPIMVGREPTLSEPISLEASFLHPSSQPSEIGRESTLSEPILLDVPSKSLLYDRLGHVPTLMDPRLLESSATAREPSQSPSPDISQTFYTPESFSGRNSSLFMPSTTLAELPPYRREYEPSSEICLQPEDSITKHLGPQIASKVFATKTQAPITIVFRPTIVIIQNIVKLPDSLALSPDQTISIQNQETYIFPNSINVRNLNASYSQQTAESREPFLNFKDNSNQSNK
ncbi:hypothetical protein SSS_01276, partial [Sarcoptes scabiei]